MPFITQERRLRIDNDNFDCGWLQPGDRCYRYYKKMVEQWREDPRWTTAHAIYADLIFGPIPEELDEEVAKYLAWQVFFQLYVMPYEWQKKEENGDI